MIFSKKKPNGSHIENPTVRTGEIHSADLSKVGNILLITGIITKDDLTEAIELQVSSMDNLKVGEILIKLGKITKDDLDMAIIKQNEMRKKNAPISQILHDLWRVNFNKNKESVKQRQLSIEAVDIHMRKVGC